MPSSHMHGDQTAKRLTPLWSGLHEQKIPVLGKAWLSFGLNLASNLIPARCEMRGRCLGAYNIPQILGSRVESFYNPYSLIRQDPHSSMKNLRCTVRPSQRNHITIATGTAGGLVKLHQPDASEEAKQLYADSNGILHLYVHPPAEDESSLKSVSAYRGWPHIPGNAFSLAGNRGVPVPQARQPRNQGLQDSTSSDGRGGSYFDQR